MKKCSIARRNCFGKARRSDKVLYSWRDSSLEISHESLASAVRGFIIRKSTYFSRFHKEVRAFVNRYEGARRRNLSVNSLAAYERTWMAFLAWAAAASLDPRDLSFPTTLEAYSFLGTREECRERAALSFAYRHWEVKNPFAKIEPALLKEPQLRYLLLADIRRLPAYLKARQKGYGSAPAFHLANALFQTACRLFDTRPKS